MNLFFWRSVKADLAEQRRNQAVNMAGQIHQVELQKGGLTVDRLLDTAKALEVYLAVGTLPNRNDIVAVIKPFSRPVA